MNDSLSKSLSVKLERDSILWVSQPHPRYPTISITGRWCALNCAHCGGKYLDGMIPVKSPTELYETCIRLDSDGARGVLLSGGCNCEAYVPFEPYVDSIRRIKERTKLFISIHSGLMPPSLVSQLADAGVDAVDFDLIGDNETVRLVLGIQKTRGDYARVLEDLASKIPYVAPHINIGLHAGKLKGERKALEIAGGVDISTLVFLVLIPTPGTAFEKVNPPLPHEVGELIAEARIKFPEIPLALGCMRPRADRRTEYEIQALKAGVDRIVLPAAKTLETARKLGLRSKKLKACCAIPEETMEMF